MPDFPHVPVGRNLTASDLAEVVNASGWFPNWKTDKTARKNFETAIAIALAESSGNPNASQPAGNPNYFGLWQISYRDHKNLFSGLADPTVAGSEKKNPYNPDDNAAMAKAVYQAAHGFTPWQTYNKGTYTKFMPDAAKGSGSQVKIDNGGADDANPVDHLLTGGKNAVDALNPANWIPSVLRFLKDSGIVVGATLLALLLLALGIWLLISNTGVGKKLGKAAEMAAVPEAAPLIAGE